jgi:5-methylcytosine-specific restriction endonuclease McrA
VKRVCPKCGRIGCELHKPKPWDRTTPRDRQKRSGSREQKINRAVMFKYHATCHVCGKGGADEVDHVIPVGEGGAWGMENRRPIHKSPCHRQKTAREAQRARQGATE